MKDYVKRKSLQRNENGQVSEIEGLQAFAFEVANQLLGKFPTVDYMDLELLFHKQFIYAYSMCKMKLNPKEIKKNKEVKCDDGTVCCK